MFALIERLFLILFVISVLRSVFRFLAGFWSVTRNRPANSQPRSNPAQEATMLHQDPVCGTYVAADTSLKKIVSGKVYHFCSPACRDRYPQT